MSIFITGTDTGVGKTVITAGLAAVMQSLGFTVGVFKPVQAGCHINTKGVCVSEDLEFIKKVDNNIITKTSYILKTPAAPIVSAPIDNVEIDINVILRDYKKLTQICDFVIVEGAGGISVPLSTSLTIKDLIQRMALPVVIVTRPDLGTINHTVLTVEYALKYGLNLRAIIISGYIKNTKDIAARTVPQVFNNIFNQDLVYVIDRIPGLSFDNPMAELLIENIIKKINLENIFNISLPKISMFR